MNFFLFFILIWEHWVWLIMLVDFTLILEIRFAISYLFRRVESHMAHVNNIVCNCWKQFFFVYHFVLFWCLQPKIHFNKFILASNWTTLFVENHLFSKTHLICKGYWTLVDTFHFMGAQIFRFCDIFTFFWWQNSSFEYFYLWAESVLS